MDEQEINKTEKIMVVIADAINGILTKFAKNFGFALIVFEFGQVGTPVNYISNAERESMLEAFKTAIIQIEKFDKSNVITLKAVEDDNEKNTEKTTKT